jgi:hypothetical protein
VGLKGIQHHNRLSSQLTDAFLNNKTSVGKEIVSRTAREPLLDGWFFSRLKGAKSMQPFSIQLIDNEFAR